MTVLSVLQSFWAGATRPLSRQEVRQQMAALCHRDGKNGVEVLLVTSSRGRWILPKGWPIKGLSAGQTAKQEAWEEAGVKKGTVSEESLGCIRTQKTFNDGTTVACDMEVYGLEVRDTAKKFPEAKRRKRKWVSQEKAVEMVEEPALKRLIAKF